MASSLSSARVDPSRPPCPALFPTRTARLTALQVSSEVSHGTCQFTCASEQWRRKGEKRKSKGRRKHRTPDRGIAGPSVVLPRLRVRSRSFDHSQGQKREDRIASTRTSARSEARGRGSCEKRGWVFRRLSLRSHAPSCHFALLLFALSAASDHPLIATETDRLPCPSPPLQHSSSAPPLLSCSSVDPPSALSCFSPPKEPLS